MNSLERKNYETKEFYDLLTNYEKIMGHSFVIFLITEMGRVKMKNVSINEEGL